ncbi:MAG: hypothetical protein ACYCWW_01990 [Deltaproteobacteria bacterium]
MLVLLALALAAQPAPDQLAQAQALARRSIAEYDLGKFDDSLRDAQAAYLLDPIPGLLFDVGQAQRALHHWEQASYSYRAYLRAKPDAKNRSEVEKLIAEMDAHEKADAAARATEAARPLPPTVPQSPLVVVEAPPAAIAVAPAPKSHAAGIVLAGLAGLGIVGAAVGAFEVGRYNQQVAQFNGNTSPQAYKGGAGAAQTAASAETVLEAVGILLAIGGGVAAAVTW